MKLFKKILSDLFLAFTGLIILFAALNLYIEIAAFGKTFTSTVEIPFNKTGLLLGTNKNLTKTVKNPFFFYRIDAAVVLYKSGKIENIIASGAQHSKFYDEPKQMKEELIKRGVPKYVITTDPAGFSTIDSIARCRNVFGIKKVTVISQGFHNKRAIYMAERFGIDAVGFNAEDVEGINGFKINVREFFARVKAFIDLFILDERLNIHENESSGIKEEK
jgi:SanA protein